MIYEIVCRRNVQQHSRINRGISRGIVRLIWMRDSIVAIWKT